MLVTGHARARARQIEDVAAAYDTVPSGLLLLMGSCACLMGGGRGQG